MLWKIITKFDVPNEIISLLKVLYANFVVRFTVDDVTQSRDCIIGVKQGDTLGHILFIFFITAVMVTWEGSCNIAICMFCSKMDATLTGRTFQAYGESFPVLDSKYADDIAYDHADLSDVIFDEQSSIPIVDHFKYLGSFISRGVTDD